MTDKIDMATFERMVHESGLDFGDDRDYELWKEAVESYQGDNLPGAVPQLLSSAGAKKASTKKANAKSLDGYFEELRNEEKAKNPQVKPQPKSNADMTATEGLDAHFSEWRKKQGI